MAEDSTYHLQTQPLSWGKEKPWVTIETGTKDWMQKLYRAGTARNQDFRFRVVKVTVVK